MKKLILIQHCQSSHHVDPKARLWPDRLNGLTKLGQRQAQCVAVRLCELVGEQRCQIYASAMQRAVETAEIVGSELNAEPLVVRGLHEFNGRFAMEREGNGQEWIVNHSNWSLFDWRPFPEAETWREFHARVCRAMEQIEESQDAECLPVVVLHGGSLSNAVVWWLRLPLDVLPERTPFAASAGSISVLQKNDFGNPVVERLNDTIHLKEAP